MNTAKLNIDELNEITLFEQFAKGKKKGDGRNRLYLYCNRCKKYYSCDTMIKCDCPSLIYRAKIHISGTKNKYRIKKLDAKTFEDAINELLILKNKLISNSYQDELINSTTPKPILLTDCMAAYMGYLSNEGVPLHKQKERTKGHIKDYTRNFTYYIDALKNSGVDASILDFISVNDNHVGYVHDYILKTRKLKNKSYNNIISALRIFTTYIIREYKLSYTNPFEGVRRRYVNYKVTTVSQKDFYNLLKVVTPENGIKTLSTGERKNLYKDWLIDAFWLGLFTGGRRDAVTNLKWLDIKVDKDKAPSHINVSDYKYNKSKSDIVSEDEKKVDNVVICKEFYEYLIKQGYEKHKGSNRYILAPESNIQRDTMKDFISKAFTHFAKIIEPEEKLEFKHLRKTFATTAYIQFGDEAHLLTGQGLGVMEKHYINKKAIQKKARESLKIFDE